MFDGMRQTAYNIFMTKVKLLTKHIDIEGNNITARITSGSKYLYTSNPDEILINDYLVKISKITCIKNKLYEIIITGTYCTSPESTSAASVE